MADYSTQWGVSVSDVQALAPHVTVLAGVSGGPAPDPDYDTSVQRYITAEQVGQWIVDVASRVQAYRLAIGVTAPQVQPALDMLAADATKNGAAAYLVDAAFPARSGVNDQASYGQVLWARYESALAAMVDLSGKITDPDAPVPGAAVSGSGEFPPVSFPDPIPGRSLW